jgi:poly(A) polymerase
MAGAVRAVCADRADIVSRPDLLAPALVARVAAELGVDAYIVGGWVRDRLLGLPSKDVDVVVVDGSGVDLLTHMAALMGWNPPAVFERFGTAHVVGDGFTIEAVRARSESYDPDSRKPDVAPGTLEQDMWRRDFTLNALCMGVDGTVLDVTGMGLADLRAGLLRTPLDPVVTFSEDPLRMVRAARFVSKLDVTPALGMLSAMRQVAHRLSVVSVERIAEELRQLLVSANPSRGLELLRAGGLLDVIAPELLPMVGCTQDPRHHRYDVWDHTMHALDAAVPVLLTRLAVLFHDVGKPETRSLPSVEWAEAQGHINFHGHEEVGERVTRRVLRRLRFSEEEARDVARLVGLHMRPMWYSRDRLAAPGLRRLVRDAGELAGNMLDVARADVAASAHTDSDFLDELAWRMIEVDRSGAIAARRRALRGEVVMAWQGRGPGPWVGEVIAAYDEALMAGVVTPDDATAAEEWLYTIYVPDHSAS